MKFNGIKNIVCHFGLLNRHFASIYGHCFQFKT